MATWGVLGLPDADEFIEKLQEARSLLEDLDAGFEAIDTVLEAAQGPLELAEGILRVLFDPDAVDVTLGLLAGVVEQLLAQLFQQGAWFLPVWPQNVRRWGEPQPLLGKSFYKPAEVPQVINDLDAATDEISAYLEAARTDTGIQYLTETFRAAVEDPWDPYKPILSDNGFAGGIVLAVSADDPASLAQSAELINFIFQSREAAAFFRSLDFSRLSAIEVREQGIPPDFVSVTIADLFPPFSDYVRALVAFLEQAAGIDSYIGKIIDGIQLAIEMVQYILGLVIAILKFFEILLSINFAALKIPVERGGIPRFIEEMEDANNQPTGNYAAGFIIMVGAEDLTSVDAAFEFLSRILFVESE